MLFIVSPTALGPIIQFQPYVVQGCSNINFSFYMKNLEEILLIFSVVAYTCTIKNKESNQKKE